MAKCGSPKRKRRKGEHICDCSAYKFPHRFGGGACTGAAVVQATRERNYGAGECSQCVLVDDSDGRVCQVLTGLESVRECPALQDYIRVHEIKFG